MRETSMTRGVALMVGLSLTVLFGCGRDSGAARSGGAATVSAAEVVAAQAAARQAAAGRLAAAQLPAQAAQKQTSATGKEVHSVRISASGSTGRPTAAQITAMKAKAVARAKLIEAERNKPQFLNGVEIKVQRRQPWIFRVVADGDSSVKSATKQPPADRHRPHKNLSDNADFPGFLRYLATWKKRPEAAAQFKSLKVADRRSIHVRDVKGVAVPMAVVDVAQDGKVIWRARTFGDGRLYFYPSMTKAKPGLPWLASTIALASRGKGVLAADAAETTLHLPGAQPAGTIQLDLAVVIDTTSSMTAALPAFTAALGSAMGKLQRLGIPFDLQIGAVAYRDVGETYLTARLPMTAGLPALLQQLSTLTAAGGGDPADALDQGLYIAIDKLRWRRASAKVIFVVTDTGPKPQTAGEQDHTVSAIRAAAMGMRVHMLALQGHDAMATLAFRQIAQMTSGWFMPLPKPTAAGLQKALTQAIYSRLKMELTDWMKTPKLARVRNEVK